MGLNSEDFRKGWRYAVSSELRSVDPSCPALKVVMHEFDTAARSIPLKRSPTKTWFSATLNSDGSLIAIPCGDAIDVYDTQTGARRILRGHEGDVGSLVFSPKQPNVLVSNATHQGMGRDAERHKEIIQWDLDNLRIQAYDSNTSTGTEIAFDALKMITQRLEIVHVQLDVEETQHLQSVLSTTLGRCISRRHIPDSWRLKGRLMTSFQSNTFSNDGTTLIYMPGASPRSNDDAQWDICLYQHSTGHTVTLSGHRDAIMWIGFSPDDSLVGSACWDGTFRIWEAKTGEQRWKWTTGRQNWTATFSPDGKRFLGTDGHGVIQIWNVETGELDRVLDGNMRGWRRAVDWSHDGRWVAVGGEDCGLISLFDMEAESEVMDGIKRLPAVQERKLGIEKMDVTEEQAGMAGHFLAIQSLKFTPSMTSPTLVAATTNDYGIDVYNLQAGVKTRIALSEMNEKGYQLKWVYLEKFGEIAVISGEAIRFWQV